MPKIPDSRKQATKPAPAIPPETTMAAAESAEASPAFSAAEAEASSTIEAGADHLQAFTVAPVEGEPAASADIAGGGGAAGNPPAGLGLVADGGEFMSPEVFYGGFETVFTVASCIPPGVSSLAIQTSEKALARECSDKLYRVCCETPSLQFLVRPGGKWFELFAACGALAMMKAGPVAAELRARRTARDSDAAGSGGGSSHQAPAARPAAGQVGAYDFAPKRDAA